MNISSSTKATPLELFSVLAVTLSCLFWGTYFCSFGFPVLFDGDTLFPERLYRDIFLENGTLKQWTFPLPAYWLDPGLYSLLRHAAGEVNTAIALYAATQICLLALALMYCVWLAAMTKRQQLAVPVFSALTALLIALCVERSFVVARMPAMHGMTIVMTLFSMGIILRLARSPLSGRHLALFFAAVAATAAGDGIFLLWFVIPAAAFLGFLAWKGDISRRHFLLCICCIALACLTGKAANVLFKPPTVDYSAVHISLSKSLKAIPRWAKELAQVLGNAPIAVGLFAVTAAVFAPFRARLPRRLGLLLFLVIVCTLSGMFANGHGTVAYSLPTILILPLFGVALLPFCLPARALVPTGCIALALLFLLSGVQATKKRPPIHPPMADCIDEAAKRYDLKNAAATFWEASYPHMFAKSDIPFAAIHTNHFTQYIFLNSSRHVRDRYDLIVLGGWHRTFADMEKLLLRINGTPAEHFECPSTTAHFYLYPGKGARLATEWDYIADDGLLSSTRLHRDADVWAGNAAITPDLHLRKADLRYRMNRVWILLHFAEAPDTLAGRELTVYAAGDRAKPAARIAKKYLSPSGDASMDALWRRLAWKERLVIGPETSTPDGEGGTIVYLEGPSRDTKSLPMLMLESDGHRKRIK